MSPLSGSARPCLDLGSGAEERGFSIAVDAEGNAHVAATEVLSKLDAEGLTLVYTARPPGGAATLVKLY